MATRSPPPYTVVDTIAWAFWGALAVIYHVVFVARALAAARGEGFAMSHRGGWIAKMIGLQGGEIAVVQALRNTLLAGGLAKHPPASCYLSPSPHATISNQRPQPPRMTHYVQPRSPAS